MKTNEEKVIELIRASNDITGGIATYDERRKESRYDKMGLGFNLDKRFKAHEGLSIRVDSWSGVYGDSGCSSVVHINNDEVFNKHFLKVLNLKFREIMSDVSKSILDEARINKDDALKDVQKRLKAIESL